MFSIHDDKITDILPLNVALERRSKECTILDLGDATIMPGMVESHNHCALDARLPGHLGMMNDGTCRLTVLSIHSLRDDLMSGVTTARCMGDRDWIDITLKKEIEAGSIIGPDLFTCGIGMRGLHGHGFVGIPHTGPEEFRRTARENILRGCDHLKVFITAGAPPLAGRVVPYFISGEEMKMVVDEGKRLGLTVSAHCVGGPGLVEGVKAGIHAFDHLYCASDKEIELLIKNNCWAVPTASVFLDPGREPNCPPAKVDNIHRCRDSIRERMRILLHSGIRYAFGTDAYHTFLYREALYANELGVSEVDCLKALTVWGAELCGLDDHRGWLGKGTRADIIAVGGNPLKDLRVLADVSFVMKNGIIYKNSRE